MRRGLRSAVALFAALVVVPTLVGCGTSSAGTGGAIRVVAAENFYGSLVAQVGGTHVSVTSILRDPNTDPHLFTASTAVELTLSKASVVIDNGAGYDPWMDRLLSAAGSSSQHVLTVATVLGAGSDANPHLWYDVPRMPTVIRTIASTLTAADPAHRAAYASGARATIARLAPLRQAVAAVRTSYAGAPVAYTERVPGYLLAAMGLSVKTPSAFARAVEDGTDPPPAATNALEQLVRTHRIRVLLYNSQAVTALTKQVQSVARTAGVPVVPVTETMPAGSSYQSWQLAQVRAITAALGTS